MRQQITSLREEFFVSQAYLKCGALKAPHTSQTLPGFCYYYFQHGDCTLKYSEDSQDMLHCFSNYPTEPKQD